MADISVLHQKLVDLIIRNGSLKSPDIEQAFRAIPRHIFLPDEPLERVYSDTAIAVRKNAENRWTSSSSQPSMMAIMLEQLDLQPGQRILEIGSGSGYNAALMAHLVGPSGRVISIDIQPDLVEEANRLLASLGFTWAQAITADGGYGYAQEAPYDCILLTVGSAVITPSWREQLADGGRLVLPLTIGKTQKSIAFEKHEDELTSLSVWDCGFMPLQGAFAAAPSVETPIGDDPLLKVVSDDPLPMNSGQLADCLHGSYSDLPSGINIQSAETWGGLFTWLSLVVPDWCHLVAENEAVNTPRIPELLYMGSGQEFRTRLTAVLVSETGVAALSRPQDRPAPYQDWNSPEEEKTPPEPAFELHIRQYGNAPTPTRRLMDAARSWDQARRPFSRNMRLRAVAAEKPVALKPGEFFVEKPWTNLIVHFDG